ncbi:MAG: hypothetical protein LBQ97_00095 [Fusobacteriaceae bacterium]|jgi:hypothetical protein|nr:hypothetical protein [Fusobacteriaceae bacterium]
MKKKVGFLYGKNRKKQITAAALILGGILGGARIQAADVRTSLREWIENAEGAPSDYPISESDAIMRAVRSCVADPGTATRLALRESVNRARALDPDDPARLPTADGSGLSRLGEPYAPGFAGMNLALGRPIVSSLFPTFPYRYGSVHISDVMDVDGREIGHNTSFGGAFVIGRGAFLALTAENEARYTITRAKGYYGGAIATLGGMFYGENIDFVDNLAGERNGLGGGLFSQLGGVTILSDPRFINNVAGAGGAIYAYEGTLILNNAKFYQNHAHTYTGGAIYLRNADDVNFTLVSDEGGHTIFRGNRSWVSGRNDGGALFAESGAKISLLGDGGFWFGDADSTGPGKDHVDSIYMGKGASFVKGGKGTLQLVGSHYIDTSDGGAFEIAGGTLRIVNDGADGGNEALDLSTGSVAIGNAGAAVTLAGQGKIRAAVTALDAAILSPDGALLGPDNEEIASGKETGRILFEGDVRVKGPAGLLADIHENAYDKIEIRGNLDLGQKLTVNSHLTPGLSTVSGFTETYGDGVALIETDGAITGDNPRQIVTNAQPGDFAANKKKLVAVVDGASSQKLLLRIEDIRELIWTGGNGVWDVLGQANWKTALSDTPVLFENGDSVYFTGLGADLVEIASDCAEPGKVVVTGGNYTFTGAEIKTKEGVAVSGGNAVFATDIRGNLSVGPGAGAGFTDTRAIYGDFSARDAILSFSGGNIRPGFTFVTVTGKADIDASCVIEVSLGSVSALENPEDKLILISAETLAGDLDASGIRAKASAGGVLERDLAARSDNKQLWMQRADVPGHNDENTAVSENPASTSENSGNAGVRAKPEAKSLSTGNLAATALLNQGGDLIPAALPREFKRDFQAFSITSGGLSQYDGGDAGFELGSFTLTAGVTKGFSLSSADVALGGFFEYGKGHYDAWNVLDPAATSLPYVTAKGRLDYVGGGALGRANFPVKAPGSLYLEGSLRAGTVRNRYASGHIFAEGLAASYDAKTCYYGWHLGIGMEQRLTEKTNLDLFAKYFHVNEKGASAALSTGPVLAFEDAVSARIRIGGRISSKRSALLLPYAALAWEYETEGLVRADIAGYPVGAPSLRGGTGIEEAGVQLTPAGHWSVDFGMLLYTGKRQGVTGNFRLKYAF